MITLTIIAFGFLLLAGGAALLHAVQHAPEGYEDEQGFHECANPRPPGTRTRVFHELRDVPAEKSACLRQGDVVAVSPDRVGPFGATISRFRERFGLKTAVAAGRSR
jgi:hypothetical protein